MDNWKRILSVGPSKSAQHHSGWGGGKCSFHGAEVLHGMEVEDRESPSSTDLLAHCTDLLWKEHGPRNRYQQEEEASVGFQVSKDSYSD